MLENFHITKNMQKFMREFCSIKERYSNSDYANWQYLDFYFLFDISKEIFYLPDEKWKKILEKKFKERMFHFHPDNKNGSQEKYFAIVNAHDVLRNTFWRKKYNAFFIDRINLDDEAVRNLCEKEFFIIFNYLFSAEERFFKTKKTIPKFGSKFSSAADVKLFYNFWEKYETNRSFDFLAYECENHRNLADQYNERIENTKDIRLAAFDSHMKYVRALIFYAKKYDRRIIKNTMQNNYAKFVCDRFSEAELKNLKELAEKNNRGGKINWLLVMRQYKSEKKITLKDLVNKYNEMKKK